MAFDGALEMACAVTLIGAFLKKEIAARAGYAEEELATRSFQNALLHHGEFDVEDLLELGAVERMENHNLVQAIHEFGGEFAARSFDGGAFDLFVEIGFGLVVGFDEAIAAGHEIGDFHAAEVGGHENDGLRKIYAAIVAEGQRGFIQHAEEKLPESVAGLFDFVEEQERKLELIGVGGRESFLGDQRMCFAMAEIARGRTDKLGNFVRVLEFGAVHLDDEARIAEENFRSGFDDTRFAGARGPKEEEIANGAAGRVEAGAKDLIEIDEGLHTLFLADDLAANGVMEITGICATDGGVQLMANSSFHKTILGKTNPFL